MEPIQGVDLAKAVKTADEACAKIAQSRVAAYIQNLKMQAHNLQMKAIRLRNESDLALSGQKEITAKLERIAAGDWAVVEPFELAEKGG